MELADWLNSIAERRWPILPGTMSELKQMVARNRDLVSFTDLSNLILSDPLLFFDLIRLLGRSAALNRNEIMPSIEQALMLVGLDPVVMRFSRLEALAPVPDALSAATIEEIGVLLGRGRVAAMIVKDWLSQAGEHKVEDCYLAALVYNLPACFYLFYRNHGSDRPLLQVVAENFETDYPRLLESFIRALGLPTALLSLLAPGPSTTRKQLLKLAVATANGMEQGCWRGQWQAGIEVASRLIGTSYDEAYAAVPYAAQQVANNARAVGYTFPARELIMLPGEYVRVSLHEGGGLSEHAQLELALREALRHLANDLKFERVMFLRYDSDRHALKLQYQIGLEPGHPMRKLEVGLEPGSFFALLTSKPQSFHAPAAVRAQLAGKYRDPFFDSIGEREFAVMSLFSAHRLSGVFYVDHGKNDLAIDAKTYQRFKEMVLRAAHHR
ncbi:HDOD domain-containing protein [Paludibacterium yongneupense]|uniref:HDOD domain-containing protein n=1 Tax=Paludibacterium yongneupense TaxID=400061 RepID=UPI00040ED565|nr:HDOD domain-containing protein [Paludibacterium yongneupense]